MEYGFWRPDELQRLWQSLATSCESFATIACRGSSRSETTAYLRGFLTALSSSAQAIGIASDQGTAPDPTPEPAPHRGRPSPPPPQWYAEDLGCILQALATAADDMAAAAEHSSDERRVRAFVEGFQAALRSLAQGLNLRPPQTAPRRHGHAGGIWQALRQLMPSSPVGILPWQRTDDGNSR
ncbi:MAG: hypothetical protein K6V36_15640 [Anaerolineae bacterium]|nr:hypothetical protein [Anaerolineae bacterium]